MASSSTPKFCYFDIHQDNDNNNIVKSFQENDNPQFYLLYHVNFILQFPPHPKQLNFLSYKEHLYVDRTRLIDPTQVRTFLTSKIFSSHSVSINPPQNIDSIINTIVSTATLLDQKATELGRSVMPVVMSIRLVFEQDYNAALNQQWKRITGRPLAQFFTYPATELVLKTLDRTIFDQKLYSSKEQCAICCEDFLDGEEITRLPCLHTYHGCCVTEWLEESCFCPICRFPMPNCRVDEPLYPFKTNNVIRASTTRRPRMSVSYKSQFRLEI
ncbi:hypothetical protein ACFE04_031681 [Oxalis oulophora]